MKGTEDDVVSDGQLVADENRDGGQNGVEVGDRLQELCLARQRPDGEGEPMVHLRLTLGVVAVQVQLRAGPSEEPEKKLLVVSLSLMVQRKPCELLTL